MVNFKTVFALIVIAAICVLSLGSCSNPSGGGNPVDSGTPSEFFDGGGVAVNPYIIDSREKLEKMRDLVNDDIETYSTAHYRQTAAIDLENMGWEPIGPGSSPFLGVYDGGGYIISNMKITGNIYAKGLFGYLSAENAVIRNVRISGVTITGIYYAGGVVGMLYCGRVVNCRVSGGSITDTNDCGGIAGHIGGGAYNALVENCYVSGLTISSTFSNSCFGGISGVISGTVRNCYSSVVINSNGNSSYAGGVVGWNSIAGLVEYCYATGDITASGGFSNGGGVAGQNNSTVRNCIALNHIISAGSGGNVGRVVGHLETNGILKNNYTRGDSGMILKINNIPYSPVDDPDKKDGSAFVSIEVLNRQDTYDGGHDIWYGDHWNFNTVWEMGTDLPILQGFDGDTQNPVIINPIEP